MLPTSGAFIGLLLQGLYSAPWTFSADVSYSWVYANPRYVHQGQDANSTEAHSEDTPLDYTHMGMIERLPNSRMLAAWQGSDNSWEGSASQGIYTADSADNGQHWTVPRLAIPAHESPVWAPVLHVEGNRVWLLYAQSRPQCTWWGEGGLHWGCGGDIKLTWSDDNGQTWNLAKVVYSFDEEGGIGKMVANKIATGANGEWFLPFWREKGGQDCMRSPNMHGKAGVLISQDQGASWQKVEIALKEHSQPTWLIEAAIAGYQDKKSNQSGFLQAFRTQVGSVYVSSSTDGHTWTVAEPTKLPNPNSKVDMVGLPDGSVLIAYNNNATSRSTLSLARSWDGGKTWENLLVLADEPQGSFSYPTLLYNASQDTVRVIYSVAYPHKNLGWRARLNGAYRLVASMFEGFDAQAGPSAFKLSQSINAWGYDAYGLRIASVKHVLDLPTAEPYEKYP